MIPQINNDLSEDVSEDDNISHLQPVKVPVPEPIADLVIESVVVPLPEDPPTS